MTRPPAQRLDSSSDEDEVVMFRGRGANVTTETPVDIFSKLSEKLDASASVKASSSLPKPAASTKSLEKHTDELQIDTISRSSRDDTTIGNSIIDQSSLIKAVPKAPKAETTKSLTFTPAAEGFTADGANDWVSRSKPGIGWSISEKPKSKPAAQQGLSLLSAEEKAEAIAEYERSKVNNQLKIEAAELETTLEIMQVEAEVVVPQTTRNVGGKTSSSDLASNFDDFSDSISDDLSDDDDEDDEDDDEGEYAEDDSDEDSDSIDIYDMLEGDTQEEKDAELARMLQWEEHHGVMDMGSSFGAPKKPSAISQQQDFISLNKPKHKKTKKGRRGDGHFPSASALADAIEQDPYGGFDIMQFDRPSLRTKRAKKAGLEDLDAELAEAISTQWEKDRQKKKERKEERQELRAQGLLGRKGERKAFKNGATRDITIAEIRDCFQEFFEAEEDSLLMPPASDFSRKIIHQICHEFGIKSTSTGKGNDRRVNLVRTRRTDTEYDEDVIDMFANRLEKASYIRADKKPVKAKAPKKRGASGAFKPRKSFGGRSTSGAGGNNALGYRDGEVVGASAPEIGTENRGRGMLERMGWSVGMSLGTDGQGILQPVSHVVKNSRAGLG